MIVRVIPEHRRLILPVSDPAEILCRTIGDDHPDLSKDHLS